MSGEKGSDGLNDIQRLTLVVQKETMAIQEETERMKIQNRLLEEEIKQSQLETDAMWKYVNSTRKEYIASLKKPLWKKWFCVS